MLQMARTLWQNKFLKTKLSLLSLFSFNGQSSVASSTRQTKDHKIIGLLLK